MTASKETQDRYKLLEELLDIPGDFGFSIPRMHVVEMLTHKGRDYHFYYDNRPNAFMTFVYDGHQKSVTAVKVSGNRVEELTAEKERFSSILKQIEKRILEKNDALPSVHSAEYHGFLAQTKELTNATKSLAEELAVIENKEEVKKALASVQAQIEGIQSLIEQQKVDKLKEALSLID